MKKRILDKFYILHSFRRVGGSALAEILHFL